jgi:WD40 repeat protein
MLIIWDIRAREKSIFNKLHNVEINSLSFNEHNEKLLALASSDGVISLFDIRELDQSVYSFKAHAGSATHVRFSPHHDAVLVSCGTDGKVYNWDLNNINTNTKDEDYVHAALTFSHSLHTSPINDMAWNPIIEDILMTVDNNEGLCIWKPINN